MLKQEFVTAIAKKAGDGDYTKKATEDIMKATFEVIADALARGESVTIPHFGKFAVVMKSEKTGVNPQNPAEKIIIPARKSAKFKPSVALKKIVNN